MKKLLYTFLAVSIIFAACKKEEENNNPTLKVYPLYILNIKTNYKHDILLITN